MLREQKQKQSEIVNFIVAMHKSFEKKIHLDSFPFVWFVCRVSFVREKRKMVSLLDQYETEIQDTGEMSDESNPVRKKKIINNYIW